MKITPSNYRPTLADSISSNKKTTEQPAKSAAQSGSASVDFSPAARQLQNLHSSQNDIDINRVEALRTALSNGTLAIDTSRIADRIIDSARDLLK